MFVVLHLPLHSEKHEKNEFQLSVNYSRLFLNFHYLALSVAEKTRLIMSANQRQGKKQFSLFLSFFPRLAPAAFLFAI